MIDLDPYRSLCDRDGCGGDALWTGAVSPITGAAPRTACGAAPFADQLGRFILLLIDCGGAPHDR